MISCPNLGSRAVTDWHEDAGSASPNGGGPTAFPCSGSKLAESTGTADIDHYLAVGRGDAAMTMDSSAALGTIQQLFAAGDYRKVKLGVGAMPGPVSDQGGVLVGGAANCIINKSAPEKQAAAYQFAKFLADANTGRMGRGDRLRAGAQVVGRS
jgi:ABC-type glycerol-3-phosphate transport system substrate-binding protein